MHPLTDFRFITMGVVLALNSPGLFADQPGQNQPGIVPGSASVAPATRILAAGGASPIQNSGQVSASADPRIGQVLGVPTSFCGHVINMLMINQMRQQNGTTGADFPPGLQFFPGTTVTPGDIELLGVHLVADGNPQQGPVFQLTIRNGSQYTVDGIRISVVGVLGQIQFHSPTTTAAAPRMEAGAVTEFQIQLPVTCMSMGNNGQSAAAFDTLVVAVDSFDELIESNELNNVQILKRAEIGPLVAVVTTSAPGVAVTPVPTSASGGVSAPAAVGPAPGQNSLSPSPAPTPAAPDIADPGAPSDQVDLDKLDLGAATETSLRFR